MHCFSLVSSITEDVCHTSPHQYQPWIFYLGPFGWWGAGKSSEIFIQISQNRRDVSTQLCTVAAQWTLEETRVFSVGMKCCLWEWTMRTGALSAVKPLCRVCFGKFQHFSFGMLNLLWRRDFHNAFCTTLSCEKESGLHLAYTWWLRFYRQCRKDWVFSAIS